MLENYVTKCHDRKAAFKFLRKSMKRYGRPHVIVTDKLWPYGAAMKVIGNSDNQERHLYSRPNFKLNCTAALTEWHQLCSMRQTETSSNSSDSSVDEAIAADPLVNYDAKWSGGLFTTAKWIGLLYGSI